MFNLVQSGTDVGPVTVTDRVPAASAQRRLVAEHVEHLAAKGLPLLLDLGQQPGEHVALTGLRRHHVPQVAHLGLADPVDPAERCSIRFGFHDRS